MPALSHQSPTVSSHSAPTMLQLYHPYPEGTSLKPPVIQNLAMSLEANRKDPWWATTHAPKVTMLCITKKAILLSIIMVRCYQ